MKTFKQFIEKAPSKASTVKTKHSRERDALADRGKVDKERQSSEFQSMATRQKGEMERAKKTDKSVRLRKAAADKIKKQAKKK